MKKRERLIALIDGSNFYHKLKSLHIRNTTKYDYKGLVKYLSEEREILSITYYVGAVRAKKADRKGQKLRKGQQRLFSHLTSSSQRINIEQGFLMEDNGIYHEKGVDVKMAVDLLIGAYEDLFDTALLISSDTDLIPAIRKIKSLNKKLEYIGFSHEPSLGLQKYADISRLLLKREVTKFSVPTLI